MSLFGASLAIVLSLFTPTVPVEPPALDWDRELDLAGAPALVHARAHYVDARGERHTLEISREGQRRLARRTDRALELFVERNARGDYDYSLADRRTARLLLVNRTNLHRIGVMTDFASLAGLVARPTTAHVVTASARPVETTALGACRWLHVRVAGQPSREICWSDRWKLPFHIETRSGAGWASVLDVDAVDASVDPRAFRADAAGLTVVRADDDIDPSQDM